jgi:hypothetical protein
MERPQMLFVIWIQQTAIIKEVKKIAILIGGTVPNISPHELYVLVV